MSWADRVKQERAALAEKLDKLNAYIGTAPFDALPREHRVLLVQQRNVMSEYIDILDARTAVFIDKPSGEA